MVDSDTKLLLHMNGADESTTFTDDSPSAHTMTAVGNAQLDTAVKKFGTASGLFDGNGDGVTSPNHADWNFGGANGGDFTIDGWIWLVIDDGEYCNLIHAIAGWQIYYNWGTHAMHVWSGVGSDRNVSWTPSTGAWHHFAIVRSGSTITLYGDGTSLGTFADGDFNNDGAALSVGNNSGDAIHGWKGKIDELRISKVARWTANFTPPTSEYNGAVAAPIRQSCDGFAFNVG